LLSALVVPSCGDHDLFDDSIVFVFSSAPALFGCSPSVLDLFVSVWVSRSALAVPLSGACDPFRRPVLVFFCGSRSSSAPRHRNAPLAF
jgi:hypothetical protein